MAPLLLTASSSKNPQSGSLSLLRGPGKCSAITEEQKDSKINDPWSYGSCVAELKKMKFFKL